MTGHFRHVLLNAISPYYCGSFEQVHYLHGLCQLAISIINNFVNMHLINCVSTQIPVFFSSGNWTSKQIINCTLLLLLLSLCLFFIIYPVCLN